MPFTAELPFAFYAIAAFVFGLLVGSFLNVVIWRVPRGESVVFPGSHCGSCGAPVKPYDNIPLISYAVLRGKCRVCKTHFSLIYPAVELLTGLLFLAVVYKSGLTWVAIAEMVFVAIMISLTFIDARHQLLPNVITYPAFLYSLAAIAFLSWIGSLTCLYLTDNPLCGFYSRFLDMGSEQTLIWQLRSIPSLAGGAILFTLALPAFRLIDRLDDVLFGKYFEQAEEESESDSASSETEDVIWKRHNRIIQALMILGVVAAAIWIVRGLTLQSNEAAYEIAWRNLIRAAFGALIGGGVIWLLRAAYFWSRGFEGMGLGDVKLMAVIGAFLGWQSAILVIILGSLLGSIVGLALARKSEDGMKTALPFGVFLSPAATFALFFGESIIQWYAGRFS
jgi:leader peptidase (prepilin peptidase)/N-methyltransferase